jgi:hypothetical protein
MQLLEVSLDQQHFLSEKSVCHTIYFDFRKAFDSVDHCKLLRKLLNCGIDGYAFNWLRSFLTDRKQRVKFGDIYSA